MKKIYVLPIALLCTTFVFAQEPIKPILPFAPGSISHYNRSTPSPDRAVTAYDTSGIGKTTDFLPQFSSYSGSYMYYYYGSAAKHQGYTYGNNGGHLDVWAQGYANINLTPIKIIGVIAGFRKKEHDNPSASATSAVMFGIYDMANLGSYNTDNSGIYNNTTLNWPGPTGNALTTASLLFSDIDTTVDLNRVFPFRINYIPFTSPVTVTGNFAISMNAQATSATVPGKLAPGDTVALISDMPGDAQNNDFAFLLQGGSVSTTGITTGKWIVVDQLGSSGYGSGGLDVDMALFAVFSNATGVNEFYNGIKLTTYPNPSVDNATIEYTLEKNTNKVILTVFDSNGRKVIDNEYGSQSAGTYKVNIDTKDIAAGTYFYQLRVNGSEFTKQLIVTK